MWPGPRREPGARALVATCSWRFEWGSCGRPAAQTVLCQGTGALVFPELSQSRGGDGEGGDSPVSVS